MEENSIFQNKLQNMILDLQQEVKTVAQSDRTSREEFFNDIRAKVYSLIERLPVAQKNEEINARIENLFVYIDRERNKASERTNGYILNPMQISEKGNGIEDVVQIIETIKKEVDSKLKERELRENNYSSIFVKELYGQLENIINRYPVGVISQETFEDIKTIIEELKNRVSVFNIESTSRQQSLHANVEEICQQDKHIISKSLDEEKKEQQGQKQQEKSDDVRERFINGELRTGNIDGTEFYIISEPEIDLETGNIIKPGVICSAAAFDDVYIRNDDDKGVYHNVLGKTEMYMTIDEARELGLYETSKTKTSEHDKKEFDDDDPFSAG